MKKKVFSYFGMEIEAISNAITLFDVITPFPNTLE